MFVQFYWEESHFPSRSQNSEVVEGKTVDRPDFIEMNLIYEYLFFILCDKSSHKKVKTGRIVGENIYNTSKGLLSKIYEEYLQTSRKTDDVRGWDRGQGHCAAEARVSDLCP